VVPTFIALVFVVAAAVVEAERLARGAGRLVELITPRVGAPRC